MSMDENNYNKISQALARKHGLKDHTVEQNTSYGGDVVDAFQMGAIQSAAGLANLVSDDAGQYLNDWANDQKLEMTDESQSALAGETLSDMGARGIGLHVASGVGQLATTMPAGLGLGGIGVKALSKAGAIKKAADGASYANKTSSALATGSRVLGQGLSGGGSAVGSSGNNARDTVLNTDFETLVQSEVYKAIFREIDSNPEYNSFTDEMKLDLARKELANTVDTEILTDPALWAANVGMSALGDSVISGVLGKTYTGVKSIIPNTAKGFAAEAPTEALQGGVEHYRVNSVLRDNVDSSINPEEGLGNAMLTEGVIGGITGGAIKGTAGTLTGEKFKAKSADTGEAVDMFGDDDSPTNSPMESNNEAVPLSQETIDNVNANYQPNLDAPAYARQQGVESPMQYGGLGDDLINNKIRPENVPAVIPQHSPVATPEGVETTGLETIQGRTATGYGVEPYQHEGEVLQQEQRQPNERSGLLEDGAIIQDAEYYEQQGLPDKYTGVIHGQDGRPLQQAQAQFDQITKQPKQLPNKDIVYGEANSHWIGGVNDKPFASERALKTSKRYKEAVAEGKETEIQKIKGGYVWTSYKSLPVESEGTLADDAGNQKIDALANEAATSPLNDLPEPTQAQKEAGNYKKGKIKLHGLDISIENPKGSLRKGVDDNGKAWESKLNHHYGDIKRSLGADGDPIDVFIGDKPESEKVFVVDQINPNTGEFDEHKVMFGFDNLKDAESGYLSNYDENWKGLSAITETSTEQFKLWLSESEQTKKPFNQSRKKTTDEEAKTLEDKEVGSINLNISQAIKRQSGKVVLTDGNENFGRVHIETRHGEQLKNLGYTVDSFVSEVGKDYNAIYKAGAGQLVLAKRNGKDHIMFVRLTPSESGDYYRVNTALAVEKRRLSQHVKKNRMELLWEGIEPPSESTNETPAFAHRPTDKVGVGEPNVSRHSNESIAADEKTDNKQSTETVDNPVDKPDKSNKNNETKEPPTGGFSLSEEQKIEDFGEKLGGARKDTWGGFAESLDETSSDVIAQNPLSKTLPQPDYEKLASEGVDPDKLAFIAMARGSIPSKPRASYKMDRWVDYVGKVKEGINRVLKEGAKPHDEINLLDHFSLGRNLNGAKEALSVIAKASPAKLNDISKYRIVSGSYSIYAGKKYNPSKVFYTIEKAGARVNFDSASDTLADAQAKLSSLIEAESKVTTKGAKHSKISIYRDRYTKQTYLGWKGSSGVLKIKEFDSPKDARDYLNTNRDEVEETLQRMKATPSMRKPVNSSRVGPERYSDNVTPTLFSETFGFRGVEFGNWVEQGKRQADLNKAFDGLIDLAEALNIPPKALSLNGQLGIAFGARGKGGVNPAAAHYEPGTVVINLTKKSGSGSLAHEWWHALDNYFGKQKTRGGFITESPHHMPSDKIRPEMVDAFKAVRSSILQSDLVSRSNNLDQRRSKAYWATNVELTARAFETYIIDKLNKSEISNDYLANVVGDEAWKAAEGLGFEDANTYPYPTAEEQKKINPTYQKLFETIKHKPSDNGNVILFNKTKDKKPKGVKLSTTRIALNKFLKTFPTLSDVNVSVTDENQADLFGPEYSVEQVGHISGAFNAATNTLYILPDNIDSTEELKAIIQEELLIHKGLGFVNPAARAGMLMSIHGTRNSEKMKKLWEQIDRDYEGFDELTKAEELLAKVAHAKLNIVDKWFNKMLSTIHKLMAKLGLAKEGMSRADIRLMVYRIGELVSKATMPNTPNDPSGIKFNKTMAGPDIQSGMEKLGLSEKDTTSLLDKFKPSSIKNYASIIDWGGIRERATEGIFDSLYGIKKAEESLNVSPEKSGYISARLASGVSDVLHGVMFFGAPQWKDGVVARKENTQGLLEVLGQLDNKTLNEWLAWMGGNRADKLMQEGRENNLTQSEIDSLKELNKGREVLFDKVKDEYNQINSAVLDLAQEAGLIDHENRTKFDEQWYVPFFREVESGELDLDSVLSGAMTSKGVANQTGNIRKLKGGKQTTKDILSNILQQQATLIEASMKNKAMLETADNLDGSDFMQEVKLNKFQKESERKARKNGKSEYIEVRKNGKDIWYQIKDASLMRALTQLNIKRDDNPLMKMSRAAKRFLTTGVTLSPDFLVRNFIRDSVHGWMINKDDFKFGKDSYIGAKQTWAKDETTLDLMFAGASFQGGYVHGNDPEKAAQQIRRALRKKGLNESEISKYLGSIPKNIGEMFEKYRSVADSLENSNRASTYTRAKAANKSAKIAAFEAKDFMDFSLQGNFKMMQFFIDVLPFFNARMQGMYKLYRASKAEGNDQFLKTFSKSLMIKGLKVATFSVALALLNSEDERYEDLKDWDKDANWHFFLGDTHIRVPKPFELGVVFGTVPERMFNFASGNQKADDFKRSIVHGMMETLGMNPIPQLIKPGLEAYMNHSFFKDGPIEGMGDQFKRPEDRYSLYTSETAKTLGQALGYSPKKIEHLIQGYFGTIGMYVIGASDMVANSAATLTGNGDFKFNEFDDLRFIRSFVQFKEVGGGYYSKQFYDMMSDINGAYNQLKIAKDEHDIDAIREISQDNSIELRYRKIANKAMYKLNQLNKRKNIIARSKISHTRKEKILDDIKMQQNAIYKRVYLQYRNF